MTISQRKKKYIFSYKNESKEQRYGKLISYVTENAGQLDVKIMRRGVVVRSPYTYNADNQESESNKRMTGAKNKTSALRLENYKAVVYAIYNAEHNETNSIAKTTDKKLSDEEKTFYNSI